MKQGFLLLILGFVLASAADAGRLSKRGLKSPTFRSVSLVGAGEYEAPTATLRVLPAQEGRVASNGVQLERIAGCHGDRAQARDRVLGHAGVLTEPKYTVNEFEKGLLSLSASDPAACVLDEQPTEVQAYTQSVFDYESYLYNNVFECGCGACFDPDTMLSVDEDELFSVATAEHKAEYEAYRTARTEEVSRQQAVYDAYAAHYAAWKKERSERLLGQSVRVLFTAQEDMPAGRMGVYAYDWQEYAWCGDPNKAQRRELVDWRLDHPALRKGQTLELWLENVDLSRSWGAVLSRNDESVDHDIQAISEESMKNLDRRDSPLMALPKSVAGRAGETGIGTGGQQLNECCSC